MAQDQSTEISQPTAASPQKPLVVAIVDALKPWKELIAILVFFGGGAAWIAGYFATKRQVDKLECFARESVTLARAETAMRYTFDEIVQKSMRIDQLEGKTKDSTATESDRLELKRLQRELKDLEERRKAASTKFESSEKSLTDGICSKDK